VCALFTTITGDSSVTITTRAAVLLPPSLPMIACAVANVPADSLYIAGLLSSREVPLVCERHRRLTLPQVPKARPAGGKPARCSPMSAVRAPPRIVRARPTERRDLTTSRTIPQVVVLQSVAA
jgi:hypothetical protein